MELTKLQREAITEDLVNMTLGNSEGSEQLATMLLREGFRGYSSYTDAELIEAAESSGVDVRFLRESVK